MTGGSFSQLVYTYIRIGEDRMFLPAKASRAVRVRSYSMTKSDRIDWIGRALPIGVEEWSREIFTKLEQKRPIA